MTQILIDRTTLEQMVDALNEVDQHVDLKRYDTAPNEVLFDVVMEAMVKGRAALANAEPAQQVPDMFWNHDDAETLYGSIEEFLNDEICNGTPLEVGDVRVIQRAVSMPKIQVRITAVHDEECEADYVEEPYVKAAP
jgi:hypothetical protein